MALFGGMFHERLVKRKQDLMLLAQAQVKRISKIHALEVRRQRMPNDRLIGWFEIRQVHQQTQAFENLIPGAIIRLQYPYQLQHHGYRGSELRIGSKQCKSLFELQDIVFQQQTRQDIGVQDFHGA